MTKVCGKMMLKKLTGAKQPWKREVWCYLVTPIDENDGVITEHEKWAISMTL
jgi:hypothetical protein